ncbi:MAG: hypothetical protein K2J76_07505 [Oscillospiraceae bacterium]|nr:hypothetical protein [Oscillospiraceae bacterium]
MCKKFLLCTILASAVCLTACSNGDTEVTEASVTTALESVSAAEQTTAAETEMKIQETEEAATEKSAEDIAVSRKYEFDLEKYIESNDEYLLRDELDFLNNEQYDTYIRAWIVVDGIDNYFIPYTGDVQGHWLDDDGNFYSYEDCFYTNEAGVIQRTPYPYYYVSTYQSFYEYLQSVFTPDAADKILTDGRFLISDGELYFKDIYYSNEFIEKDRSIQFNGGEYNLIEKNDGEVIFEYIAHQENDEKEWTETHPIKLVHTDNGWRSEFFEHLYIENNI